MPVWLPILLLIVGLLMGVAEIFFPSLGLLSVGAIGSLLTGVYLAFQVSMVFGIIYSIVLLIAGPAAVLWALRWLPHTAIGRRFLANASGFQDPETRRGTSPLLDRFEGTQGVAVSTLRPSGTAEILGERVDVITRGEIVEAGQPIEVVEVSGNRVIVAGTAVPQAEEYSD